MHVTLYQKISYVSNRSLRRGHSLTELAIIIAVLGIVAAVAMPVFHVSPMRVDAAVNKIASDIRYAQQLAMSTRRHTWVVFNVSTESYSIYIEDPLHLGSKADRIYVKNPADNADFAVDFSAGQWQGVDLTSASFDGTSELEFNSTGVPMNGNGVALTSDGLIVVNSRQIQVQAETGALILQ